MEEFKQQTEKNLEKRMYFFVPYNISPIQQAIQAGHAALEYANAYGDSELFKDFVQTWKTWIILNGGTTNNDTEALGTLQETLIEIQRHNIDGENLDLDELVQFETFYEPDLNDAMTAICFIADERVFNYDAYADIMDFMKVRIKKIVWIETFKNGPWTLDDIKTKFPLDYAKWESFLGGPMNVFLRYLLKGKRLA